MHNVVVEALKPESTGWLTAPPGLSGTVEAFKDEWESVSPVKKLEDTLYSSQQANLFSSEAAKDI